MDDKTEMEVKYRFSMGRELGQKTGLRIVTWEKNVLEQIYWSNKYLKYLKDSPKEKTEFSPAFTEKFTNEDKGI